MPTTVPMMTVISVALVAMIREMRRPYRSWAKMSRPVPHSTPSGCDGQLIPPLGRFGFPPSSLIADASSLYGLMPTAPAITGPKMAARYMNTRMNEHTIASRSRRSRFQTIWRRLRPLVRASPWNPAAASWTATMARGYARGTECQAWTCRGARRRPKGSGCASGVRLRLPAQVRSSRGGRLVQATDRRRPRRLLQLVRRRLGARGDVEHHLREAVERLERLGLGRLDHERLLHDQREVDRGRVDAVIQDRLGDVQRGHPMLPLLAAAAEDDLVLADAVVWQVVGIGQSHAQ